MIYSCVQNAQHSIEMMNCMLYPWEWINTCSSYIDVIEHCTYSVQVNKFCIYRFFSYSSYTMSLGPLIAKVQFSIARQHPKARGEFFSLIWLASSISVIGGLFLDLATTLLITLIHSHLARQGKWIILMGIIPLSLQFPVLSMWGKMDEMCDWVEQWHGCSD